MSACILLEGPPLPLEHAAEVLLDVAPLVIGRPLDLREVERCTLDDRDGRNACWAAVWRDGDIELTASVANGEGNPRDGYGYRLYAKLSGPYADKATWWRAEFYGGGWEPVLTSPIQFNLLAVPPEAYALIVQRLATMLPEHRDITFSDRHALTNTVQDFDMHGHVEWVREFLAQPLLPYLSWAGPDLCERKVALRGPDAQTARTWLFRAPFASSAWAALADSGGDAEHSAEAARFLAALTNPFSPVAIERAAQSFPVECGALAGAMAHVFLDARWRWLSVAERDAFEAHRDGWVPAPVRRVVWSRPAHIKFDALDAEINKVLAIPNVHTMQPGHVAGGPPLARAGKLCHSYGIGTGHAVRRAVLDPASPVSRSRALALCHINCEDRLASFGIGWLDPTAHVVWRSSLHEEDGRAVRTAIEFDVIDTADGAQGDMWVQSLEAAPG